MFSYLETIKIGLVASKTSNLNLNFLLCMLSLFNNLIVKSKGKCKPNAVIYTYVVLWKKLNLIFIDLTTFASRRIKMKF